VKNNLIVKIIIMKKIFILFWVFLISLSCSNDLIHVQNQLIPGKNLSQNQIDLITHYFSDFPNGTQLSIGLIKDNNMIYLGIKKENNSFTVINSLDSVYEIGAITEIFTSTILADMTYHKIIKLDDSIPNLPFKLNQVSKDGRTITYKTLANHTSGLPCYPDNIDSVAAKTPNDPFNRYDYDMLKEYLQKRQTLHSIPGVKYAYSNLGFALLGYLLETKTNKSYEDMLNEKVFSKYNIKTSTTDIRKVEKWVVKGRDSIGRVQPNWNSNSFKSAYAVLSSPRDLYNYIEANFSNDSVLQLQRQQTFSTHGNNMALGWNISRLGGVKPFYLYSSDGVTGGYRSCILMDTQNKLAIISLSNVSCYNKHADNISKLSSELYKDLYFSLSKEKSMINEAPLLKIALQKGWGSNKNDGIKKIKNSKIPIIGVWQKQTSGNKFIYTFMPKNKYQCNYKDDPEIDLWGYYEIHDNRIYLNDLGGCDSMGIYYYCINNDTLRFSLVQDVCGGRVDGLSGFLIRAK
jgi:CubicO group peptidase (beta-lactamase class C family)